ncbi:DUF4142 domain-containing protein [Candidimonas sp. SYP-B2681]|uniref:DUF4142 domain-containing protein n=1 Tax=Candidimonas sp. SYP-B2681 TaxID=2497686 RepID=UPI001F441F1D|nr:DUF4142 domain-containing protein [Candidimonas sp. SYP-B2681]
MQAAAAQKVSGDDKDFLEDAAQSGHAEIEGSKLALRKTANPDIKAFAEQMIADHTKVGDELTALAKQKGYTPPTEPSLVQATKIKAISVMDGDSFDKSYANQIGVSVHEDAVELFQETANEAKDPDIKAFAAKHLPALQQHLELARALKQKVDPGS